MDEHLFKYGSKRRSSDEYCQTLWVARTSIPHLHHEHPSLIENPQPACSRMRYSHLFLFSWHWLLHWCNLFERFVHWFLASCWVCVWTYRAVSRAVVPISPPPFVPFAHSDLGQYFAIIVFLLPVQVLSSESLICAVLDMWTLEQR